MKAEKNAEINKIVRIKVLKKFKYCCYFLIGLTFITYLNRHQSKLARKIYFDKLFNNNKESLDEVDFQSNEETSNKNSSNKFVKLY